MHGEEFYLLGYNAVKSTVSEEYMASIFRIEE
jgi:hypothetical protein